MATVISLYPTHTNPTARARTASASTLPSARDAQAGWPKYLAQRNGTFYFKRKIPASLTCEFGNQTQLWKSLKTSDFRLACRELAKEVAAFELRIATTRLRLATNGIATLSKCKFQPLSAEMIPALTQRYYVHMLEREEAELRGTRLLTPHELEGKISSTKEMLRYYHSAQLCGDISAVAETARQILRGEGLSASGGPFRSLCEALLATEVRILREQRARLEGEGQPTPEMPTPIRLQPTLTDYLAVWQDATTRPLKTVETVARMVRLWHELMGEMPASNITPELVDNFRDKLMERQLSAATIRNRLGLLRAVVNDYHREKHVTGVVNPFDKVRVKDKGQRMRSEKDRRAFDIWELNTIYAAPLFTEHLRPRGQAAEAGYWSLLMGPFVGARIEEIAQMRLADVEIINGVWTLRICDLDKSTQGLKTQSSFRRIPIHEELIRVGFLRYLCELKRRGEERLFPSLQRNNKYGRWSNALGKWVARFLDQLGLESTQLDYHSFRYNFKQRLTQCGAKDEVRDALSGHWLTQDNAGRAYMKAANRQYPFPPLHEAIKTLRYEELNLVHLYVDDPYDGVDASLFTAARKPLKK